MTAQCAIAGDAASGAVSFLHVKVCEVLRLIVEIILA